MGINKYCERVEDSFDQLECTPGNQIQLLCCVRMYFFWVNCAVPCLKLCGQIINLINLVSLIYCIDYIYSCKFVSLDLLIFKCDMTAVDMDK